MVKECPWHYGKTGGYPVGKHQKAATVMADSIEAGRWVHTFGCGHATIPVEEMYPRIGSFVGFHPLCELPLTFFTQIIGQMGIHQFLFLERAEGYGQEIMKNYDLIPKTVCGFLTYRYQCRQYRHGIGSQEARHESYRIRFGQRNGRQGQPSLQRKEPLPVGRYRSGFLRSPGRRLRTFEEPLRQGRSVVYIEFRHHGMDDHHYRCRNPCRPWRTLVHPSVAQRSG